VGRLLRGRKDSALHHHNHILSGWRADGSAALQLQSKPLDRTPHRDRGISSSQGCKTCEITICEITTYEITGLDIERKRAMFPKHKIAWPGFLRLSLTLARNTTACHLVDAQPSRRSRTFKNRN
jgi:hypothetical protein